MSRFIISIVFVGSLFTPTPGLLAQEAPTQLDELYFTLHFRERQPRGVLPKPSGLHQAGLQNGKISWQQLGLGNVRAFALAIPMPNPDSIIYTANGNGVFISKNLGQTWRVASGWQITEVQHVAVLPGDGRHAIIGTAYGVWTTSDFGETWQHWTQRYVAGLLIDRDGKIWIGEQDRLLFAKNAGDNTNRARGIDSEINIIVQHPDRDDVYLAGSDTKGIYQSEDAGKTWRPLSQQLASTSILWLAYDKQDATRLYAAAHGGGLLISTDSGVSWEKASSGLPETNVHTFAQSPAEPNLIIAGTYKNGLFLSVDRGETWRHFGFPESTISEILWR